MSETREEVILAGISVRAPAQSAWRTGYAVYAVDAFGDRDLAACARATLGLVRDLTAPYSARAAAEAALRWNRPVAGVAYGSGFENHPEAVAMLARGRPLWGNGPDVLSRVRDPLRLGRVVRQLGFPALAVRASPPALPTQAWLRKPRRSGGGQGIAIWEGGPVPRDQVLQERIEGVPGSVSFMADGRRAAVLGLSEQLVGDPVFGAAGYRYCGSLIAPDGPALFDRQETVWSGAAALASALTAEFGLVGLNGLDFIARDGVPYALEVNPRYSASMELFERAGGPPLFGAHVAACRGELGATTGVRFSSRPGALGKAIVFARGDVTIPQQVSDDWLADAAVADVPHPGERVGRGHPICTIFAQAADPASCRRALAGKAAGIYAAVEARDRVTAWA